MEKYSNGMDASMQRRIDAHDKNTMVQEERKLWCAVLNTALSKAGHDTRGITQQDVDNAEGVADAAALAFRIKYGKG